MEMRVEVRVRVHGRLVVDVDLKSSLRLGVGGGMVIFNVYVHNASHRTAEVMVPRG